MKALARLRPEPSRTAAFWKAVWSARRRGVAWETIYRAIPRGLYASVDSLRGAAHQRKAKTQ